MVPDTSASLLEKLRHADDAAAWNDAWRRFVELYTPVLYAWLARRSIDLNTADQVVHETFSHLVEKMRTFQYDETKKFRHWLRTVANRILWLHLRRRSRAQPLPDQLTADSHQSDPAYEFWENEFRAHVLSRALDIMKRDYDESTWKGFLMRWLDEVPVAEIAARLGKKEAAVNAANYRIMTRLREELAGMLD